MPRQLQKLRQRQARVDLLRTHTCRLHQLGSIHQARLLDVRMKADEFAAVGRSQVS
jgi:hypothetical protein